MIPAGPLLAELDQAPTGDPGPGRIGTGPDPLPAGAGPRLDRLARALARATSAAGTPLSVDPRTELQARTAHTGGRARGPVSAGGASRLLAAADGWVAVSLSRPEDRASVPAWLTLMGQSPPPRSPSPWAGVAGAVRRAPAAEAARAGQLLGLAVAVLDEVAVPSHPLRAEAVGPTARPGTLRGATVVDLSSLWAGPLCGRLLARAGATVLKVESTARPDGTRRGPAGFFAYLNQGKRSVVLDLGRAGGRAQLRDLLATADVVVESSRPRVWDHWGIDPAEVVSGGGVRAWLSITGYGRRGPEANRVAFGDDAAVAGGLVARDGGRPGFVADAAADPLSGVLGAAAVAAALGSDRRWLLDVALARTAAWVAGPERSAAPPRPRPRRRGPRSGGPRTLIRRARLTGRPADVVLEAGVVRHVRFHPGDRPPAPAGADLVVEADGGTLLPGLHDHHLHLLSLAASLRSLDLGEPGPAEPLSRLARAPGGSGWLRVVGYHESMGPLDRSRLDVLVPDRPVRVQHRSGSLWILNSAAADRVGLDTLGAVGVERDAAGRPTGRLFGLDDWLRERRDEDPPDLAAAAALLHRRGVTGVTDLTPVDRAERLDPLVAAARAGLALRLTAATGPELAGVPLDLGPVALGPVKVYLADHALPPLPAVLDAFGAARAAGRPVAVHAVSRDALALALAAWRTVGPAPGDRLEHGALVPRPAALDLGRLGVTVVTQPHFVVERGDRYLDDVDPADLPTLYPFASLLAAGVAVGVGTDAPFGTPDPWRAVRAAARRRTAGGRVLGAAERVPAPVALRSFLAGPQRPGGPSRRLGAGVPADLCLLEPRPLGGPPGRDGVRATWVAGRLVFGPGAGTPGHG